MRCLASCLFCLQRDVYATWTTTAATVGAAAAREKKEESALHEAGQRIGPFGARKLIKLSQRKVKRHKRKRNTEHTLTPTHSHTHTQRHTLTHTHRESTAVRWLGQQEVLPAGSLSERDVFDIRRLPAPSSLWCHCHSHLQRPLSASPLGPAKLLWCAASVER